MTKLTTLILAAGKGTRMKSDLPKVLHKLHNKALIVHVIEQARAIKSDRIIAVIGHQKNLVIEELKDQHIEFAIQDQQLGTGHAVQMAEDLLKDWEGDVLILSGDVPLLSAKTLQTLLDLHQSTKSHASVLTTVVDNPHGYGRILRNKDNTLDKIVEEKDADEDIRRIKEINSGIYLFKKELLFSKLRSVKNENTQNEYYLPDVLPIMLKENYTVSLCITQNSEEIHGINTIEQLQDLEKQLGE